MSKSYSYKDLAHTICHRANNPVEYKWTSSSNEEGDDGRQRETDKRFNPLTLRSQILILIEIHTHPRDSYNSCNLRITVKLLLLLWFFSIKSFHVKPCVCVSLFSMLCFVRVQYSILLHLLFMLMIDRPITCDGKSPLETGAFIKI